MRRAALLLAVALAGCSAVPPQSAPSGFDAADWLARARPASIETVAEADLDDERVAQAYRLAAELDAATGWMRACDTHWDSEAQRLVTEDASAGYTRGLFSVHDLAPDESIVAVTCDFGAYQGTYALVHLSGARAALLAGQPVGTDGTPYGPPSAVYATPTFDAGGRSFATLGVARGLGDCGIRSAYEITGLGTAALVEARSRDCDDRPEDAPPADAWPVVYPR